MLVSIITRTYVMILDLSMIAEKANKVTTAVR
jgi:hypothetical protein